MKQNPNHWTLQKGRRVEQGRLHPAQHQLPSGAEQEKLQELGPDLMKLLLLLDQIGQVFVFLDTFG